MKKIVRLIKIELRPNKQVGLSLMDVVPEMEKVNPGEEFARQMRTQLGERVPKEAIDSMKIFFDSMQTASGIEAYYYNSLQHYLALTEREFKEIGSPQIGTELTIEMKSQ